MHHLRLLRFLSLAPVLAAALAATDERTASACGGCFTPPTQYDRTVVTDHRMAFAISPEQTVLWDQIKYSGDPKEFAWVLPVRPGARIELANDAFFAALDASTQPTVASPAYYGGGYGCALTGCGSSANGSASPSSAGGGGVQIISQQVVGPYETVTLRSTDPKALETWLVAHAYDIPDAIRPTIDQYVAEGFDFLALRLVPLCNERSMRPVRIVSPGADASLPLRMIAAGVGAHVGITLYVITEGRYRPQNFPEVLLDDTKLRWDRLQNRSNYEELSVAAMATSGGHAWLTEYAGKPQLSYYGGGYGNGYYGNGNNPGLGEAYYSLCAPGNPGRTGAGVGSPTPCTEHDAGTTPDSGGAGTDAGGGTGDAGEADAGDGGASEAGVGGDAGDGGIADAEVTDGGADDAATAPDSSPWSNRPTGCEAFDDLDTAITGLHPSDIWVTRLRATLPVDALKIGDLRLEAALTQELVSNEHQALQYADETKQSSGCISGPRRHQAFSAYALLATTALAVGAMFRRRTRR